MQWSVFYGGWVINISPNKSLYNLREWFFSHPIKKKNLKHIFLEGWIFSIFLYRGLLPKKNWYSLKWPQKSSPLEITDQLFYDIVVYSDWCLLNLTQGLVRTSGVRITSLRSGGGSSFFTGNSAVLKKNCWLNENSFW